MRNLILLLVFFSIGIIRSQTFTYYKVGQNFKTNDNACLVIKKDLRLLLYADKLDDYQDVKAIKLIGFTGEDIDMDSLLTALNGFTKIRTLIFENCDLNLITEPLAVFSQLDEIIILKKCSFTENMFFPLLKENPVTHLRITKADPSLITDSMKLLRALRFVSLSNNSSFSMPNRLNVLQLLVDGNEKKINMEYCGNFYKKDSKVSAAVTAKKITAKPLVQFDCIKQPIPGIKINDTVYSLNDSANSAFVYKSGTRLQIPAGSFLNTDGSPYTGKVNLFYRELRTPVEIMLSGIPMTNKDGDKTQYFRSGGMYEINATDPKGSPLKTKTESSIKIAFALTDTSSSFGFYSLQNDGQWATVSNSVNIVPPPATKFKLTKAVKEYLSHYYALYRQIPDTTNYYARYYDPGYLYTYRKDNLTPNKDSMLYASDKLLRLWPFRFINETTRAFFKVRFVKETKEKDIIYTIVPAKKDANLPE
ncbi:MAG: hypothetical protein H0W61_17480, partial [Bacteroidetes bacterium]|nr:hypothetical protein [Bacteroidota bacterium]